jgi:hypothetical protein
MFFRSADRLLRTAAGDADAAAVLVAAADCAPRASGRVLLSLREHLQNRVTPTDVSRVFAGQAAHATAAADTRPPLDRERAAWLTEILDAEITCRLSLASPLLIDPAMYGVALPLSGKAFPGGLGVLPRGSVASFSGEILRFFCYWRQAAIRTDYDLSALMLTPGYAYDGHVSWTSYHHGDGAAVYSGDITSAPHGATEFVDIRLAAFTGLIVPQVHVYDGESFADAAESFFGFMIRDTAQQGAPFEPATVRMKSGMRGDGRAAMPVVFLRGEDGRWRAKWLHLYARGPVRGGTAEVSLDDTSRLVRAVVERDYLRVSYLAGLVRGMPGGQVATWDGSTMPGHPVTFIGLEEPEGLPEGSRVITPANLASLIPE